MSEPANSTAHSAGLRPVNASFFPARLNSVTCTGKMALDASLTWNLFHTKLIQASILHS